MAWLTIIIRVIPVVISLMRVAEELFDGEPETGPQKKDLVMQAIKAIIGGASGFILTPELWKKIEGAISLVIDAACLFLFPKEDKP